MRTSFSSWKQAGWAALPALLTIATPAHALKVFACEPEWAALTRELAGDQTSVYTGTQALQDPHLVQAKPSLIAAVRNADLVVCTGAELEVAWLPVLLRQAGNPKVQPGQPGHFEAAASVRMLDVPARLDRADGDVHAEGNPHIQTDPRNMALVAVSLAHRLSQIDPAQARAYEARLADFNRRWGVALQRWSLEAAPLRGTPIVVQHKGFPYLENWLGLKQVAALEPKPGIEPSSSHLSGVLKQLQQQPAKMVIRAAYNDGRGAQWLAERAKLPVVVLPFTVGGSERAKDLFGLFDDTVARLLAAAK